TVLVVPVETPPLHVHPDMIETRVPAYRHYDNMAIPLNLEEKIFRSPGGILIAGQVDHDDDVVEEKSPEAGEPSTASGLLTPLSSLSDRWLPTLALAADAENHLLQYRIETVPNRHVLRLPMPFEKRTANLNNWRNAVEHWYEQETALVDYRKSASGPVDAVLEIGIRQYYIFEGQTSLQVLLKWIDPITGRVIARTSQQSRSPDASAQYLLSRDGSRFKSLIRENGRRLLVQGFNEIGPRPLSLSQYMP
ncbi:MAG: hypothetical protein ACU841_14645, partial [Gammaproteobacteria bacterium]